MEYWHLSCNKKYLANSPVPAVFRSIHTKFSGFLVATTKGEAAKMAYANFGCFSERDIVVLETDGFVFDLVSSWSRATNSLKWQSLHKESTAFLRSV